MSLFADLPTDPVELAKLHEAIRKIEQEQGAHYAAIGRVACEWALFEYMMDDAIERLGGFPIEVACLTANIVNLNKLDSYTALAKFLGSKRGADLEALKQDARGLAEQRNRVIHDTWLLISPAEKAMRFERTARGKLRAELIPMKTSKVLDLVKNIEALTTSFVGIAAAILAEVRPTPSPDTAPPAPAV
jgi:hypothetical protein